MSGEELRAALAADLDGVLPRMAFHGYGVGYNEDPDFDIEAYYLRVADELIASGWSHAALAAPSTPEPSGPVAALLRAASPDRHNTIDFGPPPKSPFLVVHGDVPEEMIRAIRDAVLAALRAAPSTEPALDAILGALRDGAKDCPADLDTDDARTGWSAAFIRAEWLVEDVFDARLAESQP